MKRNFLLICALAIVAMGAKAQVEPTIVIEADYDSDNNALKTTDEFMGDHIVYTQKMEGNTFKVQLYNDQLQPDREITVENASTDRPEATGTVVGCREIAYIRSIYDGNGLREDLFSFTKTLFNDDERAEFVIVIYKAVTTKEDDYLRTKNYITRFDVVSEDGTVLGSFLPPAVLLEHSISYIKEIALYPFYLGGKYYLSYTFHNYESYKSYQVIYPVDKSAFSGVAAPQQIAASSVFPNPVKREQELTIRLANAIEAADSYVQIMDIDGKVWHRQPINTGASEIKLSSTRFPAEKCFYSVVSGGKVIDSGKVIVH